MKKWIAAIGAVAAVGGGVWAMSSTTDAEQSSSDHAVNFERYEASAQPGDDQEPSGEARPTKSNTSDDKGAEVAKKADKHGKRGDETAETDITVLSVEQDDPSFESEGDLARPEPRVRHQLAKDLNKLQLNQQIKGLPNGLGQQGQFPKNIDLDKLPKNGSSKNGGQKK